MYEAAWGGWGTAVNVFRILSSRFFLCYDLNSNIHREMRGKPMPERIEKRGSKNFSCFSIFHSLRCTIFIMASFSCTKGERNNYIISSFYSSISHNQSWSSKCSWKLLFSARLRLEWERKFNIHDVKRRMKLLIDLIRMMLDHLSTPSAREIGRRTCEWEFASFSFHSISMSKCSGRGWRLISSLISSAMAQSVTGGI